MGTFDKQVGGDHYAKLKIQPIQLAYLVANGDACFCKVAKYLGRDKTNREMDLGKAIDVVEKAAVLRKTGLEITHYKKKMVFEFADQFENAPLIAAALLYFLSAKYESSIKAIQEL